MTRMCILFRAILLGIACLAFGCVGTARTVADQTVDVPFTFEAGYVVVEAKIRNDVLITFVLSTGSEFSSFDMAMLEKYKLQAYYTGVGIITGHNDQVMSYARVPDIRLGGEHESMLNMRLTSLAAQRKRTGRDIAGILGADFFSNRTVQFDFAKQVLRFLPKDAAVITTKTAEASHRSTLTMRYFNPKIVIPIADDVMINGKKIKTMFDTAQVTVVSVSAAAAKQLGLPPATDKAAPRADKISSLRLSETEDLSDLPVWVFPKNSTFDRDELEFGAVVGTVLLKNFIATFDYRKKLIILER